MKTEKFVTTTISSPTVWCILLALTQVSPLCEVFLSHSRLWRWRLDAHNSGTVWDVVNQTAPQCALKVTFHNSISISVCEINSKWLIFPDPVTYSENVKAKAYRIVVARFLIWQFLAV